MNPSSASHKILPFSFAKRHGVFLDLKQEQPVLCHKPGLQAMTLAEVGRYLQMAFACRELTNEEFERALSAAYERDSSEAMQMVEDLGEEMDLASIANSVTETADLLEQEDDAPIIRLINAVLSEAIKINASDIHIEPSEKRLQIRFRIDGVLREAVQG